MLTSSLPLNIPAAPISAAGYTTNSPEYLAGITGPKGEFLANSALSRRLWPIGDPSGFPQATRTRTSQDSAILECAASAVKFDADRFLREHRNLDLAQRAHLFLTSRPFQFNSVNEVRGETIWIERIRTATDSGRPIDIVYPLFSKIMNWAKQMGCSSTSAGEEVTLRFLSHFNRCLRQIYPPGANIHIVVDATLYNSAIQNPEPTVRQYFRDLGSMMRRIGGHGVFLHDYAELLAEFSPQYRAVYLAIRRRLAAGLETAAEYAGWLESLRASINTLRFPLSFQDHLDNFGPERNPLNPWHPIIETLAREGLREIIAIKAACNEINLPERLWPGHVRVTCHRGRKLGRALPGLRVYPRFFNGCRTLPYHGLPLLCRHGGAVASLEIHPEIVLRGRSDLTRVLDGNGETTFYEEGIRG